MPPHLTTRLRSFALALSAVAALAPAVASPASAEEPTPQAINAHAEFLAYPTTPPPPAPVKVCVVDTGVDLTTDAAPAVVERYSEFGGTVDDTGGGGIAKHGTYVAGVIASQWDGVGSVGIWPRARIVSVRVFPDKDSGTTVATYLHALNLCRDRGSKVINLSLSGLATATGPELAQLQNKIIAMKGLNQINVVAAAGNNGAEIGYPAAFPSVLAVGGSDSSARLCDFSSRGPELDISALGCGVITSLPGGAVGAANGTSYSAPVVSAALAALRAYRPDLTPAAAEQLLTATARTVDDAPILDLAAAFHQAELGSVAGTRPPAQATVPTNTPIGVVRELPTPILADPLGRLGIKAPRARHASYARGRLTVEAAIFPDFARAVFTVDGRRYIRPSGTLRLKLSHRPRRVLLLIEVPGVGRTRAVAVKLKAERKASKHADR